MVPLTTFIFQMSKFNGIVLSIETQLAWVRKHIWICLNSRTICLQSNLCTRLLILKRHSTFPGQLLCVLSPVWQAVRFGEEDWRLVWRVCAAVRPRAVKKQNKAAVFIHKWEQRYWVQRLPKINSLSVQAWGRVRVTLHGAHTSQTQPHTPAPTENRAVTVGWTGMEFLLTYFR